MQRSLVGNGDTCNHCIYTPIVHIGKADAGLKQELMAGVLHVVLIVGIVDNSLQVALIVAHLHL